MDLPDCYRHIDWATWGLYGLERLSEVNSMDAPSNTSVFSRTDAYQVVEPVLEQTGVPLGRVLADGSLPSDAQWRLHKQFSAGLRYAFLLDKALLDATVRHPLDSAASPELTLSFDEGTFIALRLLPDNASADGQVVLLQGGDPSGWYDVSRWTLIQPLSKSDEAESDYPLSNASYFDPRFDALLREIGARRAGQSEWHPPPASATPDMLDYVRHHPSLRGHVACSTAESV